jgi:hypothetical protein
MPSGRPIVKVDAFLNRVAPDLAPGARERLERQFVDGRPHSANIGRLVGYLAGRPDQAAQFFKPGSAFAKPGETTLHAILRRLPLAAPDKPDKLGTAWHTELWSVRDPARLAESVVERLDHPDNHQHLDPAVLAAEPPPPVQKPIRTTSEGNLF